MIYTFDLIGTAVFAITGCIAASQKKMDLFGGLVLAVATAIGGGTIRDLVIGASPVFWVQDHSYIIVSVLAALAAYITLNFKIRVPKLLTIMDAFGLAIFTLIGTQKAMSAGCTVMISIAMGIMTGVFGGIIRDILSGRVPLIFRKEIYATASFLGALFFFVCLKLGCEKNTASVLAIFIIVAIRLTAIKYKISLPKIQNKR